MAMIPLQFQIFLLLLLFVSTSASTESGAAPSLPPSAAYHHPQTLLATILSSLGFKHLSTATAISNISATTPLTIFASADISLLTCPSCSLPLLLREFSLPGLYPLQFLKSLTFGTKIETLAPNRCLTITSNNNKGKIFINGVEITRPDLFNNGLVAIHGVTGFVSHLSPISCNIERMTSISFPSPSISSLSIVRLMLNEAVLRLKTTGHSVVSLALLVKYADLAELKSMTIFALDDSAIFSAGGNAYLSNFRYHVVPNRRLTAAELVSLPVTTALQTMDAGNNLVVTAAGGGGNLAPMKINSVKITTIDLLRNSRIVIHGISAPFLKMH